MNQPHRSKAIPQRQAIPAETIEAVRMLSPIDEVISEHVRLRRTGAQLLGLCLFHADKSPSFSVHPEKRVFRCHGCGVGGDVFQFVRLQLKCGFRDAVSHLARRAGIRLEGFEPSAELRTKVAVQQARREEQRQFAQFCAERIATINACYRDLARAANHAEECLRAGESDPVIHDMAWAALERFRTFEARIEREGLCDLEIIRREWERRQHAEHAA